MKNGLLNILIVEDSPTQAEELRFILEQNGYKASVAKNGKEALTVLETHVPDVVITDVLMPEMDGYELCKQIRSNQRLKDLPVILVTTLSDPTDVIRGLEVGANYFITKPYEGGYLVSRLQYLIANRELRKNLKAEMGINVFFFGQNYFITAERLQILDLLLSTYENAYHQNRELLTAQKDLRDLNERLEEIVKKRTEDLLQSNNQLKIELAERLRAEEEKSKLQAQLHQAQKMESIGRLAGGVAHDYNNMLSVIIGYTQMALEKVDQDSPLAEDLKEIFSAAKRTTDITRQLLTFARKQTIEPRALDLNATIEGMLKMLKRLIGEDVELTWNPQPELWTVKIDPSQIDQMLANLCINARDAITGVGKIHIETGMVTHESKYSTSHEEVAPGDYVFLSIQDNGCGMNRETLDKIFEPFFTTKEIGKGTGLGLSTVYGIVRQHKGFINVMSDPGVGTKFEIYLPRFEGGIDASAHENDGEIQQGHGETILIVEDEKSMLKLVSRILNNLGYVVLAASNPLVALEIACRNQNGTIDLVLTDMIMPGMNGLDLTNKLQALHPNIKCLFMSGYTARVIANQSSLAEGIPIVQKPFSKKELAKKIQKILKCSHPSKS